VTILDPLSAYDYDEQAAIIREFLENPEKPIEKIIREICDQTKERWMSLFSDRKLTTETPKEGGAEAEPD
jgi:hypothetical protein